MSTNATLRNNLAKRGSNILCGNIVNKEKEIIQQTKKTTVINQSLLNANNQNCNMNSSSNIQGNLINNAKNNIVNKLDNNKIKVKAKENNENDKNANNIFLKRKMTVDVDNSKKYANNNSYALMNNEKEQIRISVKNQNVSTNHNTEINSDMNVSMKETKDEINENTEMATEEVSTNGYVLTNNNNESKTQRNPIIDPKRSSLPIMADNQFIVKSLLHGEIKKRPILNNANNISNNNFVHNNCDDFITENGIEANKNADNQEANKSNSLINGGMNANNSNKLNFKSLINGISINNNHNLNNVNYSFNLENISISKENAPKFSNEEYRRMITRLIKKDMGRSVIQNLFNDEDQIDDFLANHKVTERMRTRMIDWMIEVLTNYKCDDNTFFIAVNTMDRYFKALDSSSIQPGELHLIGVVTMFMASKYEDIYPLRLKIVHEKIAHKKLSTQEIKNKETDISTPLNFILGKPTQWDFINQFIEEIFFTQINNFQVQDKTLCETYGSSMGSVSNNLLQSFSEYETEIFKNYTTNMINLLRHVVVYLAKMNCHDYILSTKKPSLIAASTIFVAMKICEQINKEEYVNEYFSKKLTEISQKNENEIIKTAQKILYNAQNFDSIFNGLENLKKIHFNAIIDLKNTK